MRTIHIPCKNWKKKVFKEKLLIKHKLCMSRNIFRCEACFNMESQCFNNLLCNKVRFTAWEKWTPNSWCMQTLYIRRVICHALGHSGMICSICCSQPKYHAADLQRLTYSLTQGNSWNTSGPNTEHSHTFVVS